MTTFTEEDVQEIHRLLGETQRPAVKSLLQEQLVIVKRRIASAVSTQPQALPKPIATTIVGATERSYATISNYAWDGGKDNVKIYIDLPGVHNLPADNVVVTLVNEKKNNPGLDLRIYDLKDKNYRLYIDKLNGSAVSVIVVQRKDRLIVTLKKGDTAQWSSLKASDSSLSAPAVDKNEDPSASIMNMMKQMYEEGDEETKRTIAKAWSESKNKTGF